MKNFLTNKNVITVIGAIFTLCVIGLFAYVITYIIKYMI